MAEFKAITGKGRLVPLKQKGYWIDESGNIYSQWGVGSRTDRGVPPSPNFRQMKNQITKLGYYLIKFGKHGKSQYVHKLMLEAFVCERPPGKMALHRNDIRTDNRLDNLYWGTPKENCRDMAINGKRNDCRGEDKPAAKLTEEQVHIIRNTKKYSGYLCHLRDLYGVSKQNLLDIRNRKTWRHI